MKVSRVFFLLVFIICYCNAGAQSSVAAKPFVLGEVLQMQSTMLNEKRVLNIYLPEGYTESDSINYPVIYLLDGSADEDFIHVAGLVQFYNFSWINILPKSILVGVANVDRRHDLTFPTTVKKDKDENPTSGGSLKFMDFMEKELQPLIRQKYKTSEKRMLIGQSLGGLFATEVLFRRPYLFDQYLIVSPSTWWDNQSILKLSRKPVADSVKIYIAVGEEGKIMKNGARAIYSLLKKQGNRNNIDFDFLGKENHATILHKAIMRAFEGIFIINK
jgi:predicted alpha/beta superfamily hydrolase